jgi:hypothetical protein
MPKHDLRRKQRVSVTNLLGKHAGTGEIVRLHRNDDVSVSWDRPAGHQDDDVRVVSRVSYLQCTALHG